MRRRHELSLSGQDSLPVGTTFDFDYTGTVQSIDLPRGRYKLQCWGAQGGSVTGDYSTYGFRGGYSEGIINLEQPQTLYIFVGGEGGTIWSNLNSTDTTRVNGGWNGGGSGFITSYGSYLNTTGQSFPSSGGGATDISLIASDMSYSSGRTNRSDASLKSRIIVAGGGGGSSVGVFYYHPYIASSLYGSATSSNSSGYYLSKEITIPNAKLIGEKIDVDLNYGSGYQIIAYDQDRNKLGSVKNKRGKIPSLTRFILFGIYGYDYGDTVGGDLIISEYSDYYTINSSEDGNNSYGGGVKGGGFYGGYENTHIYDYSRFGFGESVLNPVWTFASGGGGGGWNGGGTNWSDSEELVLYGSGGSGFVNIPQNAQYRPSGYTGLELESGQTIAGNTSFPSTSGGSEIGHSGNGFARITAI